MYIEILNWDSDFFGYKIGRINISKKEIFIFSQFKKLSNDFKLIYVFSDKIIKNKHLKLVDQKVTLSQELFDMNCPKLTDENIHSFNKDIHCYRQLKELVLTSGVYSRFNVDGGFNNNEYEKLYHEWIKNLIEDKKTIDIIIYVENDEILGFTTIKGIDDNLADIGLVAVSQKARGKGVGTKLINNSKRIAFANGFDFIQVVTQKNNLPAIKLYEKCNFKSQKLIYIYHFWNI